MGYLPIDAANFLASLGLSPLLETGLMDVVAAGSFTPYYLFAFGFKFRETDRAITGDFFAV